MNKQEEIRGNLKRIIDKAPVSLTMGRDIADKILSYLDSENVKIQVDREWDIGDIGDINTHGIPCNPHCHNMERKMLKEDGLVAVERLIE